jgi:hypothetical protein
MDANAHEYEKGASKNGDPLPGCAAKSGILWSILWARG